jgi:hypothetical protein
VTVKNTSFGVYFLLVMNTIPAAVYAATLNIGGDISVTGANNGTILFNPDPVQPGATFRVNTSDGVFAALSGTFGRESTSLSARNAPINTIINLPGFLIFLSNPTITFTLTELLGGNLGPCFATTNACTPAGTPFNFVNTSASSSSASFTVIGNFIVNGATQPGRGVYSASFPNQTLQQILAVLTAPNTSLVASSAAQFTTTAIVPEPNTAYILLASGVVILCLHSRASKLTKTACSRSARHRTTC